MLRRAVTNKNASNCANAILAQMRALQAEIIQQICYGRQGVDARYIFQRLSALTSEMEALQRHLSEDPAHV